MTLSAETLFSVLAGGLVSALVTLAVAEWYFRRQDRRAEEVYGALSQFLEKFAKVMTEGGDAKVIFGRDEQGRIKSALTQYTITAHLGAVVVKGEDADLRSEPGPSGTRNKAELEQDENS